MTIFFPPSPSEGDKWIDRESGATFSFEDSQWVIDHFGSPWRVTTDLLPYFRTLNGVSPPEEYTLPLQRGQILVYDEGTFTNVHQFISQTVSSSETQDILLPPFNMTLSGTNFIGNLSGKSFGGSLIEVGHQYLLTFGEYAGIYRSFDNLGAIQLQKVKDSNYWSGGEIVYDEHNSVLYIALISDSSPVFTPITSSSSVSPSSRNSLQLLFDGLFAGPSLTWSFGSYGNISLGQALRRVDGIFSNIAPYRAPFDCQISQISAESATTSRQWTLEIEVNGSIEFTEIISGSGTYPTSIQLNSGDLVSAYFRNPTGSISNPSCLLYLIEK
jgi:hypothetical protein